MTLDIQTENDNNNKEALNKKPQKNRANYYKKRNNQNKDCSKSSKSNLKNNSQNKEQPKKMTSHIKKSLAFNPLGNRTKNKNTKNIYDIDNYPEDYPTYNQNTVLYDFYKPFTKDNMLYSYIRQLSGFNESKFWELLNDSLQEKKFNELKTERLSLISYIVIYNKEIVYGELLNKFGKEISQEEFEKCLFIFSLSKNSIFIEETIKKYTELFEPNEEFQSFLINNITKFSYRKENNDIILSWLSDIITENNLKLFWDLSLKENNVVLFEQALMEEKFNKYLKQHYHDYKEKIELISKKHITEQILSKSNFKKSRTITTTTNKKLNDIKQQEENEKTSKIIPNDDKILHLSNIKNNNLQKKHEENIDEKYLKCLENTTKPTIITKRKRKTI